MLIKTLYQEVLLSQLVQHLLSPLGAQEHLWIQQAQLAREGQARLCLQEVHLAPEVQRDQELHQNQWLPSFPPIQAFQCFLEVPCFQVDLWTHLNP